MVYTEEYDKDPFTELKGQLMINIFVTSIVPILSKTMDAKARQ